MTYSVERHKSPEEYGNLLVERYHVEALRQVGCICVNDVLEVLGETLVEWV